MNIFFPFQDKLVGMHIHIKEVVWIIYVSLMIPRMGSTNHIPMGRYMEGNMNLVHITNHQDGMKVWTTRKSHVLYATKHGAQPSWQFQVRLTEFICNEQAFFIRIYTTRYLWRLEVFLIPLNWLINLHFLFFYFI